MFSLHVVLKYLYHPAHIVGAIIAHSLRYDKHYFIYWKLIKLGCHIVEINKKLTEMSDMTGPSTTWIGEAYSERLRR